jgi:hypothetical protein
LLKAFDVFQLLAKRAGASLSLNDVRRVGLRSRGSPEGTWVTFLLYWADTPEYVIVRDGYRIVTNPFAASIHAIERAELDSVSPEIGYVEASAVRGSTSDNPKGESAVREGARPSSGRNHFWLRMAREIGLETANVFGKVRDRWNALTEAARAEYKPFNARVGKGKPGWETVRKGIDAALKDESDESEN